MPKSGPSGFVRGARGNARPYRDSSRDTINPQSGGPFHEIRKFINPNPGRRAESPFGNLYSCTRRGEHAGLPR
jgi:hypothetical protein